MNQVNCLVHIFYNLNNTRRVSAFTIRDIGCNATEARFHSFGSSEALDASSARRDTNADTAVLPDELMFCNLSLFSNKFGIDNFNYFADHRRIIGTLVDVDVTYSIGMTKDRDSIIAFDVRDEFIATTRNWNY